MNGVAATTVAAALGEAGESKEAKAAPPPKLQGNLPGNPGSLPGTFVPFGWEGEAAKASAYGLAEITKALSRRGLYPQSPKNEKFKDLVQALANL